MDTSAIAGTAFMIKTAQTQQAMTTTMMKQAADQQNQIANMLAQNAQLAPQQARQSGYTFSTYA
jgi:hypothetical protein